MKKLPKRNGGKVRELNDKELDHVNGGSFAIISELRTQSCKHIHDNCGGEILNVGNLFAYCKCKKCGMERYWLYSFDYTVVYEEGQ